MARIVVALPIRGPIDPRDGWYAQRDKGTHQGMDFSAPVGTPIFAMSAGEVVLASDKNLTAGTYIIVKHGGANTGLYSRYLHLSKRIVSKGDSVGMGELIGYSGNTGTSAAPHLHFDVQGTAEKVRALKKVGLLRSGRKASGVPGYNIPVEQIIPGTGDPKKWPLLGGTGGGLFPLAVVASLVLPFV